METKIRIRKEDLADCKDAQRDRWMDIGWMKEWNQHNRTPHSLSDTRNVVLQYQVRTTNRTTVNPPRR
jgi:hypothetical protein